MQRKVSRRTPKSPTAKPRTAKVQVAVMLDSYGAYDCFGEGQAGQRFDAAGAFGEIQSGGIVESFASRFILEAELPIPNRPAIEVKPARTKAAVTITPGEVVLKLYALHAAMFDMSDEQLVAALGADCAAALDEVLEIVEMLPSEPAELV